MSAINLILRQVIYIFPTLPIDTQLGHIHGHLWPQCENDQQIWAEVFGCLSNGRAADTTMDL